MSRTHCRLRPAAPLRPRRCQPRCRVQTERASWCTPKPHAFVRTKPQLHAKPEPKRSTKHPGRCWPAPVPLSKCQQGALHHSASAARTTNCALFAQDAPAKPGCSKPAASLAATVCNQQLVTISLKVRDGDSGNFCTVPCPSHVLALLLPGPASF
jgi:hypothetical protein